jgi:hypothetical protein
VDSKPLLLLFFNPYEKMFPYFYCSAILLKIIIIIIIKNMKALALCKSQQIKVTEERKNTEK